MALFLECMQNSAPNVLDTADIVRDRDVTTVCPGVSGADYNQTTEMTFHEAAKLTKKGDVVGLRRAFQDGLSPNLCNQYSWTLLMVAALEGNTSIGSLLIECGAELDTRNKFHDTALSSAAHTGHASFVDLLLRNGASLDCHPFGDSLNAWLSWACQYGRCTERIRELFENERKIRTERDRALDQLT